MDDLFKTDINFPVLGVSCLPFIKLLPIAIGKEEMLLKVCVRRTPLEQACRTKKLCFRFINLLRARYE